jgi:hypothetical protein
MVSRFPRFYLEFDLFWHILMVSRFLCFYLEFLLEAFVAIPEGCYSQVEVDVWLP